MKIVREMNTLVKLLLSQKYDAAKYIPSCFNVIEKVEETYIVFNTFTRALIILDKHEFSLLNEQTNRITNETIIKLIKLNFLVDADIDETKQYTQIQNFNRVINLSNNKIKTFKIYTTTYCNARCFYCFEEGISKNNMSDKTADAVIDYIYKNKSDEKIKLYWFGGEPLCNQHIINKICTNLAENNVEYESTIVTNGYLLDKQLIDKAVNKWNLSLIQITLDGFGEEHNKRKAYVNPLSDPFNKTIENIKLLSKANIKLIIRLNFDNNNLSSIKKLIPFLKQNISDFHNVTVAPVLLKDNCFSNKSNTLMPDTDDVNMNDALIELQEILYQSNMHYYSPVYKQLPTNSCIADNPKSVVISTDGKLYTCQNCDEEMCYGDIFNGITNSNLLDSWRNPKEVRKKCYNCVCLPECTSFDKCPVETHSCLQNKLYNIRKKMIATVKLELVAD